MSGTGRSVQDDAAVQQVFAHSPLSCLDFGGISHAI